MSKPNPYDSLQSIKAWAEDDRPREKLMNKGRSALSDAELIAILLGSGSRDESAVHLAQRILASNRNDLNALGKISLNDLMQFKGVGLAKAVTVAAALELGRRRKQSESQKRHKVSDSRSAYELIYPHLSDLPHEEFYAVLLNRSNQVIEIVRISQGGIAGTVADVRLIFKKAIESLASSIIVAHNHPSGNLQPSQADIQLTKKLKDAGKILDVQLLDHLVVGDQEYFSFADEGLLS